MIRYVLWMGSVLSRYLYQSFFRERSSLPEGRHPQEGPVDVPEGKALCAAVSRTLGCAETGPKGWVSSAYALFLFTGLPEHSCDDDPFSHYLRACPVASALPVFT